MPSNSAWRNKEIMMSTATYKAYVSKIEGEIIGVHTLSAKNDDEARQEAAVFGAEGCSVEVMRESDQACDDGGTIFAALVNGKWF